MPRTVKVHYSDGSQTVFQNVPDTVTAAQVARRASAPGKNISLIDGGANSSQQTAPAPQPQAATTNWLQKIASVPGQLAQGYANATGAAYRGIQDQIPGINHLQALSNEIGSHLPGPLNNGTDNRIPYSQRVQMFQQQRDAAMNQDVHGNSLPAAIGHYAGEVEGALGAGLGEAKLAGKLFPAAAAALAAPAATKIGTIGKLATGGAVAGAVAGAGNTNKLADLPGNVAEGAAAGAVVAPAAVGGVKIASILAHPVSDFLNSSSAAGILRRYVSATAEDIQNAADAWRARTGSEPTLFEVLPQTDRQNMQKMLQISPDTTKAQAAQLIQQRAQNIGQDMTARVGSTIAQPRNEIINQTARDLATSRGDAAPTNADITQATQAVTDPTVMNTVRQTINTNLMAPHDGTVVANSIHDLVPQEPVLQPDGSVTQVETNPDVSRMIRTAGGVQNLDPNGVTVSDITAMASKLRKVANTSPDYIQASTASTAANHLAGQLPPDAAAAFDRMSTSNQNYKQMLEGWDAGKRSDLRQNVSPTGNFQLVQNQYDTPAGAQGRVLGQAQALENQFSQNPGSAINATQDLATNPSTQQAVTQNLDATAQPTTPAGMPAPSSGDQLADAAQAQTQSAQNLADLNTKAPSPTTDLPGLAGNLLRLNSFSPASKAQAASNLLRTFTGTKLPPEQTSQLVDSLFSQNPTKIDAGLKFLNNAGDLGKQALSNLNTGLVAGGAAANSGTEAPPSDQGTIAPIGPAIPDDGSEGLSGGVTQTQDPNAPPAPANVVPGPGVDPSQSPYMAQLQQIYNTGDPKLLGLANIVQQKESAGRQFDDKGNVITSPKGAVGLMQVEPSSLPDIAKKGGFAVDQVALHQDPAYNKMAGTRYLDQLLTQFGGDRQKAAAAYNAGPGAVSKALGQDPTNWLAHLPSETQNYAGDIQP